MAVTTERRLRRAIFLDRDGTLVENVPYNVDSARLRFADGAAETVCVLRDEGFRVYVVSNQSGVARGLFDERAVQALHDEIARRMLEAGAPLDGFYYCPHHPDGSVGVYRHECDCRKPAPGMLLRAASEHGLDLSASWMVGDILNDIEAGRRAGCRTALVDNGGETEWRRSPLRTPDVTVARLRDVPEVIATTARSVA